MYLLIFFFVMSIFDCFIFFFFNDTATTEIYTLSLHDALPICAGGAELGRHRCRQRRRHRRHPGQRPEDRKSTRLNSSHVEISYAVFCLKKKKEITNTSKMEIVINVYVDRHHTTIVSYHTLCKD